MGCGGPLRAIQLQHDVIGIATCDEDDAFSRNRRIFYLCAAVVQMLGINFLLSAAASNERGPCPDPGDAECQITMAVTITIVFKGILRLVMTKVLPNDNNQSLMRLEAAAC